jgi:hypothetical protein
MLETNERGAYACRTLPDGRHLCVYPISHGKARLFISRDETHTAADEVF